MKRIIPLLVTLLLTAWILSGLRPPALEADSPFDLDEFSRLPVLANGRLKPMDTMARTHLLNFQGRQRVKDANGTAIAPIQWLLDVFFRPAVADDYQTFEIVHRGVLDVIGLSPEEGDGDKRFSFKQLEPALAEIDRQAKLADGIEMPQRNAFQRAVIQLHRRLILYQQIKYSLGPGDGRDFLVQLEQLTDDLPAAMEAMRGPSDQRGHAEGPVAGMLTAGQDFMLMDEVSAMLPIPAAGSDASDQAWQKTGAALLASFQTGKIPPAALAYAAIGQAWQNQDPASFNLEVQSYRESLEPRFDSPLQKTDRENLFNSAEPFYRAMVVFVLAFILAITSWLVFPGPLRATAECLLAVAFVVTTLGIGTRMWLEGRPPVTNLYSSALFVGWGAVLLCVILERLFPRGIAVTAGGLVGFATLLIAHHLSLSGDTLEMMRAVLDSNFWLATHVIVITVGYSATYLAGVLATIHIIRSRLPGGLDKSTSDALNHMVYGIICFATLFSLVGTILGGIWADQSWGRFWGWDPKENGALIIVLWNAVILHVRWGGLCGVRGLMALAVFGNIITSWSWFGTNMLGVGLHSYGFMDSAFWALVGFVVSQLLIIAIAYLPTRSPSPKPTP